MATEETKQITKHSLQQKHQQLLQTGFQNDDNEHEIVQILGGIDRILSHLLQSNVNITHKEMNDIHQIISNPQKLLSPITSSTDPSKFEDKGIDQKIIYKLYDDETILTHLFGSDRKKQIINIATNKITIAVLFIALMIYSISYFLIGYGLPMEINHIFASICGFQLFIYSMVWILYGNKKAIKLLLKEFEFYFKLYYLLQFLVAYIVIRYLDDNVPIHIICAGSMYFAAFSFLVMIFDAINIKKENKLIFSSLAAGWFAWFALLYSRMAHFPEYQNDVYQRSKITISNGLIFSDLEISLIDTAGNSAKILTIFMCKQFVSSIIRPNQSLIIKIKPTMQYETSTTPPKQKHVKLWRIACIIYFCLGLIVIVSGLFKDVSNMNTIEIIVWSGFLVWFMIVFCFFISNNIKYIMIAIIIIGVSCFLAVVIILYMHVDPIYIAGALFLLGMVCGYLLKLKELRKFESGPMDVALSEMMTKEEENRKDSFIDDMEDCDDRKTEEKESNEIASYKIMDGKKNNISLNKDDSKTYDEEMMDEIWNDIDDGKNTISPPIEMKDVDDGNAIK